MRALFTAALAVLALSAPASAYNVTISSDPTSNGSIINGVFKATGPNAVLNNQDLQNALATGDLTVQTTAHGSVGDITVAVRITWAANTLTLDAFHSIIIKKRVQPTATSGLALTFNDGGTGGDIIFGNGSKGSVNFDTTAQSLKINAVPYTLVDTVSSMATNISGNPSGNFAFAHNDTETAVFTSIPVSTSFSGNFAGLGNTLSGLQVHNHSSSNAAFFSTLGSLATVKDFILSGMDIQGGFSTTSSNIAGLVINNAGLISNVAVTGTVQNTISTSEANIAGLAVYSQSSGKIISCHSTADVSSVHTFDEGGLVAQNLGLITQSYATGDVSSTEVGVIGGLAGIISSSGTVTLSYAKGHISSPGGTLGGFVGSSGGTISESFSLGDIDSSGGTAIDGGFAGTNSGSITDAYERGDIVGQNGSTMGGFVGQAFSTSSITTSYSTGGAAGGTNIGGFIGINNVDMTVTSSYWNTSMSGLSQATSNGNDSGITGLTTAQMRAGLPAGFSSAIWTETVGVNFALPYLIDLPPP
ncbi:MAG: hypothetical protein JOZ72_17745 [Alphaproteobacteria bacterium]|nr:hypothetical protein [Alphaproteobacteria bacterium]